jgi:hypothetical protein
MVSMDKFTTEKWNIGVNHEYLFLALMRMNNIILHNLNIKDTSSSVDFQVPNTNIYIEMKYRQIPSYKYNTSVFDKKKVDIWNSSKLSDACIYICLEFEDGKYYFIKYNKDMFDSFDKQYLKQWNTTNYLIPLNQCIGLEEFIDTIKQLTSSC